MKIVFLADALDTQQAGIHYYCNGLLQALDALTTKHQLYVVRSKAKNQFNNITEIEVPIKSNIPLHQRWRQFSIIPKTINQLKPDVVVELAHFGPFNLAANIKRVTFIHDISPVLYPQWHPKASVWAHRLLLNSILKKTTLILTNTNFTKSEIIKKYPKTKNKIEVTHLGCAINEVSKKQQMPSMAKPTIETNMPYFLYVGTLEPRKNITTLIKAFELFLAKHPKHPKHPNISLILAGAWGWKYKSIEAAIQQSSYKKNIICTGYITDTQKIELLKNAIAFIYPSLYEGFGIPIVEAMRFGCPVICSNIGSIKEVAGDKAAYFNKNDANALCKLMNEIIINPPNQIRKEALIKHSQKYTWQTTAKKTLAFIEQL